MKTKRIQFDLAKYESMNPKPRGWSGEREGRVICTDGKSMYRGTPWPVVFEDAKSGIIYTFAAGGIFGTLPDATLDLTMEVPTEVVPWTRETLPVPWPIVRYKSSGVDAMITGVRDDGVWINHVSNSWETILEQYILPDGSPCGREA